MTEEFDGSAPSVSVVINDFEYFCADRGAMIWHCNSENPNDYLIEWTVEDYRGAASELDIDLVYIADPDWLLMGVSLDIVVYGTNSSSDNSGNYYLRRNSPNI